MFSRGDEAGGGEAFSFLRADEDGGRGGTEGVFSLLKVDGKEPGKIV